MILGLRFNGLKFKADVVLCEKVELFGVFHGKQ